MDKEEGSTKLGDLVRLARQLGASDAAVIPSSVISVEDELSKLCREPQCQNYGLAASCPPHVCGPSGFRKLLKEFELALVFKIDVPSRALFSNERKDIFGLLHEIAATIEQSAARMGYVNSKAYAGGSCKNIFCNDHPACRAIGEGGECRFPEKARPSMSGFGINVSKLMKAAGWTLERADRKAPAASDSTASVCGLVLVG